MTHDKAIQKILIVVAMEAEAAPMIERMGLTKEHPSKISGRAPVVVFSGEYHGAHVLVACNGKDRKTGMDNVGTTAATLCTYLTVEAYQPDLVISVGTSGGFKARGGAVGKVYIGTSVINHDRRIPIPGFDKYGIGHYDCCATPNLQSALGLEGGCVTTGNCLGWVQEDMDVMTEHAAVAKEMEGAAIGWVCDMFSVPFFCVKAITDIVDGDRPSHEEFLENLASAAKALQDATPKVVDFVIGKKVSEL